MATASVSYSFVNGATNDGPQVTQNFTDVVNFLNNQVVHKDGSVTMTGALSLPASDPVSANQAARKSYVDSSLSTSMPIGSLVSYIGASAPNASWLLCDGTAVSRSTYATLFGIIGTTYGVGDGSTTFALPDLRGRVPVGTGTGSGLTARALGAKGGAETLPAHTHQSVNGAQAVFTASSVFAIPLKADITNAGWSAPQEVSYSASNTGSTGTGSHGAMQPFVVVNFIIKVL